jgi:excisionase family DNA binding protein
MMQLEHELYKAREVAALLRLNTKTLYGWIKRGRAFAIRTPTGGIRIRREEVLRLVDEYGDVAGGEGVDKHLPHE